MKKWLLLLPIVLLAAGCDLGSIANSDTGDVVMYPVQCNDWFSPAYLQKVKNNIFATDDNSSEPPSDQRDYQHCKKPVALSRQSYHVDKKSNTVIWSEPDQANSGFTNLSDCTIIDIDNWSCGTVGFKDGRGFNNSYIHVISVSKLQWQDVTNADANTKNASTANTNTTFTPDPSFGGQLYTPTNQ